MAQIVWTGKARREEYNILLYGKAVFGIKSAQDFFNRIVNIESRLLANPEMGFPEPLLAGRKRLYRAIVVRPHFKLIYWWNERHDTIHIADIWDSRREPSSLSARI